QLLDRPAKSVTRVECAVEHHGVAGSDTDLTQRCQQLALVVRTEGTHEPLPTLEQLRLEPQLVAPHRDGPAETPPEVSDERSRVASDANPSSRGVSGYGERHIALGHTSPQARSRCAVRRRCAARAAH